VSCLVLRSDDRLRCLRLSLRLGDFERWSLLRVLPLRSGDVDVDEDRYVFVFKCDDTLGELTWERLVAACFSPGATTVGLLPVLSASPSSTSLLLTSWLACFVALTDCVGMSMGTSTLSPGSISTEPLA
jgi:hypothetical protein